MVSIFLPVILLTGCSCVSSGRKLVATRHQFHIGAIRERERERERREVIHGRNTQLACVYVSWQRAYIIKAAQPAVEAAVEPVEAGEPAVVEAAEAAFEAGEAAVEAAVEAAEAAAILDVVLLFPIWRLW